MQTPLAVLRLNLDMLVQHPDLTEEQTQIIQTLYEATSRMVRINKNLLLLAKMENPQFRDTQTINVAEAVEATLSFLAKQIEAANISIETRIADRALIVKANTQLFESLINNVITNAIKHNVTGGVIIVILEDGLLNVINTGIQHELDGKMLFRRFVCMNHTTKGSGLGLAIARQICLLYDWEINYSFENEVHRFAVWF
jgi:signal transduction histidine kinase